MLYDNDTFEHRGRTFRVEFPYDDSGDTPWDREDGHGPVSGWTTRNKTPGERVLHHDHGSYRYYDFAEAVRIAKRKWCSPGPDLGKRAAEAAEADFQRLRAWCNDQWSYVGVVVHLANDDGDADPAYCESLWGIESDAGDYLEEVARELAGRICAELADAMAADIAASRPDLTPAWEAPRNS